jgi:hypothetical protein
MVKKNLISVAVLLSFISQLDRLAQRGFDWFSLITLIFCGAALLVEVWEIIKYARKKD